jgi:aspartate ammonia-lyase
MMADNVWQSIDLLANVSETLVEKCITEIEANEAVCREYAEKTPAVATALAPHVGYDEASSIAKQAVDEDRTITDVAADRTDLTDEELDEILDLREMTEPGIY